MGIDTQLHVKSRNADTSRVELLQRKLVLLEHSGELPAGWQCTSACFCWPYSRSMSMQYTGQAVCLHIHGQMNTVLSHFQCHILL